MPHVQWQRAAVRAAAVIIAVCSLLTLDDSRCTAQDRPVTPQPRWIEWPAKFPADGRLGVVLSDVAARSGRRGLDDLHPSSHWAHEGLHRINSEIRDRHPGQNGFYILDGYGIRLHEPSVTLTASLRKVPYSYPGSVDVLFDSLAVRNWNQQPLYSCDEWTSYLAGSAWSVEFNHDNKFTSTRFALDCAVVATCVAWASASTDEELKRFLQFNWERTAWLANLCATDEPLQRRANYIKQDPAADEWRSFAKTYFGQDWCRSVLGLQ